jgi:hypothetical protein
MLILGLRLFHEVPVWEQKAVSGSSNKRALDWRAEMHDKRQLVSGYSGRYLNPRTLDYAR